MELAYSWEPVSLWSRDLLRLLRKSRGKKLDMLLFYADMLYRCGVDPTNRYEPFYWDDAHYPSVLGFTTSACIEGGFLLPDLQAPLQVLEINGGDPAKALAAYDILPT